MGTLDNQRAKELAIRWGLNVRHALYRATGNWYHRLKKFPGALLDADGYVIFESSQAFEECPQLQVRKQVSAPKGIKAIPSYVYVSGDRDRQSPIVMAEDIKIIEQIEKQIGKKLKHLPLKKISGADKDKGYALDNTDQVQGLNLDGTKVKDISILENLVGLTHLSLANNQITDLTPLRELTNLTLLNLKNNQITELKPLRPLIMLTTLILERNQITDITPLSAITKLTTLWLNSNQIADPKPLSVLTNLKELYLWETQLKDITPLSALTMLTKLDLCGNQITDLTPLSALTMLTTLILERTQITDITPLRELKYLKALNIRQNRIERLPPDITSWWPDMEMEWKDSTFNGGLNLYGNPLTDPPVKIVKQGKAAIKNYFNSLGDRQSSIVTLVIEDDLRKAVAEGLYNDGKEYLQKLIKNSPGKKDSLIQEFGFIYDYKNPDQDKENWKQKEAQINWRRKVWQILSINCNFELSNSEESKTEANNNEEKTNVDKEKVDSKKDTKKNKKSWEIGEELEQAVFRLFEKFFKICELEKTFQTISSRQQDRGRQSGYDLKFVVGTTGNKKLRILIECKHYAEKVILGDISNKLMAAKVYHRNIAPIDHWILVSPNAKLSNELDDFFEEWEKNEEYPFKVQALTKDVRVKEFFGLIPEIYNDFIQEQDLEIHPKDWNEEKRQEVIEFWKQKLEPPLRLPKGWGEYLRNSGKFLRQGESQDLESLYDCHVPMNCLDETGALVHGKTLEDKVTEWLEKPLKDHPTLILLGDFGDGKTTFCYILSRKLAEQFLKSPSTGWLPVRFSLKDFSIKNVNTSREFLRRRLEEIGADMDGWDTLAKSKYKLLAILDGFDEMSKKMDHKTILANIEQMIECCQHEFSGMKVLIASRKHFFENQQQKNQLLQRIGNPQILMLAPIKRIKTEEHLREYAKSIGEEDKFNILINRHDPIGLASKPLYLEMLKGSLKDLPNKDLDELTLYETYIKKSLERKGEFLEDKNMETSPETIIENMKGILESIAVKLHQAEDEFIYLSDIQDSQRLINRLWNMSDPADCTGDDEMGRIAVRSLLKRIETGKQDEGKQWPVDFCHRSMREYFVARAICKMVEQKPDQAKHFLRSCCLSYEIIFFASKMMKDNEKVDYTEKLWQLVIGAIYNTKNEKIKAGYLGSNAANLLYRYKGTIPKDNWSHLALDLVNFSGADLSGKKFIGTSFCDANLDNVNFTNADFTGSDLTGVRLEDASPVRTAAVSRDENIYALYEDGVIREWKYERVRAPYSINLGKIETTNDIRLIAQPGSDLTLVANNQLLFYDKESLGNDNAKISQKARIEIKSLLKPLNATHENLLLIEEKNNRYSLQMINLENQSIIQSLSVKAFTLCAPLGHNAFIIYDRNDGLQVVGSGNVEPRTLIQPETVNITCLSTCPLENTKDRWRIAFGQENGSIIIFNIYLSTWELEEVVKYSYHQKAVRYITFIDDHRLVSGGIDRKLFLTQLDRNETISDKRIEFRLHLQCKGMKIEKLQPEKTRLLLEKLIAKDLE